ncbi:MAG TPA: hypothetical protein VMZ74_05395 [Ramlibacter sp.]|nr:hypothetical protein [Ramlibacter sp.]
MVAFVSGNTLGLSNSSLALLGRSGVVGDAQSGRAGEQVYVNAATGDLIIQRQDEWVDSMGFGVPTALLRTYNSQGKFTDDNADNWQMSVAKTLGAYTANVSITRNDGDGTSLVYNYDSGSGAYVCKSGAGAFDTLKLAGGTWTWTDGASGATETYDASQLRIRTSADRENKVTSYGYTGSLVTTITDAAGEITALNYTGTTLNSITTTNTDASTTNRVSYGYDSTTNKLNSVTAVTSSGKTYVTTYGYNTKGQLSSVTQPDGSKLGFTYDTTATPRVTQVTQTMADGSTRLTKLTYNTATKTTITDPLSNQTVLNFDGSKRIASIVGPSTATGQQTVSFSYDPATGEIQTQTDARNNVISYSYDAMGRQTDQISGTAASNGTGNSIHRSFSSSTGVLLSETVYLTPDPDGSAGVGLPSNGLTTNYVYNSGETHVLYAVSPQGRVTQYSYDAVGHLAICAHAWCAIAVKPSHIRPAVPLFPAVRVEQVHPTTFIGPATSSCLLAGKNEAPKRLAPRSLCKCTAGAKPWTQPAAPIFPSRKQPACDSTRASRNSTTRSFACGRRSLTPAAICAGP